MKPKNERNGIPLLIIIVFILFLAMFALVGYIAEGALSEIDKNIKDNAQKQVEEILQEDSMGNTGMQTKETQVSANHMTNTKETVSETTTQIENETAPIIVETTIPVENEDIIIDQTVSNEDSAGQLYFSNDQEAYISEEYVNLSQIDVDSLLSNLRFVTAIEGQGVINKMITKRRHYYTIFFQTDNNTYMIDVYKITKSSQHAFYHLYVFSENDDLITDEYFENRPIDHWLDNILQRVTQK